MAAEPEEIITYRCACGEVLIQTEPTRRITPERIERIECPNCHTRYQHVVKQSETGQEVHLDKVTALGDVPSPGKRT